MTPADEEFLTELLLDDDAIDRLVQTGENQLVAVLSLAQSDTARAATPLGPCISCRKASP